MSNRRGPVWERLNAVEPKDQPRAFIQWKGTTACLDFWCPDCETASHFDAEFLYSIRCDGCQRIWALSPYVIAVPLTEEEAREGGWSPVENERDGSDA